MKKTKLVLLLLLILVIPLVNAEECGLTNLAVCLPEKFFGYLLEIVNAPLQPFLTLTKNLLSEPVNIDSFVPLWAIIVYVISLFYGIFIAIAGFNFIISGYSAEKRELAKEWLKNIILMVVFVQASYYLYSLLLELSSAMTAGVLNSIDPNFFLLTIDNIRNIGMEITLAVPYLFTLLLTIILLTLRYLLAASGVLFFPIGLFFHFIPSLKSFGKLIMNILLVIIFMPFFQSLALLAASKIVLFSAFDNYKILVMTTSFILINISMILLVAFAAIKAAFSVIKSDEAKAISYIVR